MIASNMIKHKKWFRKVESEVVPTTEKVESKVEQSQASPSNVTLGKQDSEKTTFQKIVGFLWTLFCFVSVGFICWHASIFFHAPEFSEVKAQFEQERRPEDGERIAELGKICRNGAGTPMACKTFYESFLQKNTEMMAQKP